MLMFQWDGEVGGARATRQLLSQRVSGSREPIIGKSPFYTITQLRVINYSKAKFHFAAQKFQLSLLTLPRIQVFIF
jgi:hypothetical protein